MRRIILVVAGVVSLGLAAVPATAGASPAPNAPLLANGYYSVVSAADGDSLAYSIPSNVWYDASTNVTNVKTGGGGTWQEIHNANSPGYCWTEDWPLNVIRDKTPCSSLASQLFQIIDGGGNPIDWHIQNEWMNQHESHICGAANGDQPTVLTTPAPNDAVYMGCPAGGRTLGGNQQWELNPDN